MHRTASALWCLFHCHLQYFYMRVSKRISKHLKCNMQNKILEIESDSKYLRSHDVKALSWSSAVSSTTTSSKPVTFCQLSFARGCCAHFDKHPLSTVIMPAKIQPPLLTRVLKNSRVAEWLMTLKGVLVETKTV